MTPPMVFGVPFYVDDEKNPIEVSHEELLALRSFGLVRWSFRDRRFENSVGQKVEALAFLDAMRAGAREK